MRSKTSCFNRTLFFSGIKRFWPLWAAYLIIWVLSLPLPLLRELQEGEFREINYTLAVYNQGHILGLVMGAIFSLFSAMAVWSFLYNPRSASGFASLPVRREGQFFSALLAGFLPLAAGNLIIALLTLPVSLLGGFSPMPLLVFFCVVTLIDLFFFGFATLCAQLTGHILVLPAVYAVLNFVAVAVEFLLRSVLSLFVYGMDTSVTGSLMTRWLSPPIGLALGLEPTVLYDTVNYADGVHSYSMTEPTLVSFTGWGTLLAYAGAGLVCMLLALLLLRRRRMETAGDVVAVPFLRGVFRWCMALGCGLCLASFLLLILSFRGGSSFGTLLVSFLLGGFIGWFAGEMLLKKSFRVFRGKTWAGFGACCAVILVLMLGMRFDLFGYERRVPAVDRIESATVYCNGSTAELAQPESLEQLTALHRAIIADKALNHRDGWGWGMSRDNYTALECRLIYTLKGGRTMSRYYHLAFDYGDPERLGEAAALRDLLNIKEAVVKRTDFSFPKERNDNLYQSCTVYVSMTAEECAAAAGFANGEEYVLSEYLGYSPAEAAVLGPEKRRELMAQFLEEMYGWDWTLHYAGPQDLEGVYFEYPLSLDPREAEALYRDCIRPDLEEGYLGKVWVLPSREQEETEYSARIEFYWELTHERAPSDRDRLTVSPTVYSQRTNAWLAERGIVLHTAGEVQEKMYRQYER